MPKAYSADIRCRVIARIESGASRREAAEEFEISPSAAVKWVKSTGIRSRQASTALFASWIYWSAPSAHSGALMPTT
jgi:transposase